MSNLSDFLSSVNKSLLMGKLYQINRLIALILCVISISSFAIAAPADLDPTFGNLGRVVSEPDGTPTKRGNDIALLADGKIIMVGALQQSNNPTPGIIIARYNSNGSLDTTFGTNGLVTTTVGAISDLRPTVAIQPDGKIVVGVIAVKNGSSSADKTDFGVVRFNADGSLDTTFDDDGKTTVSFVGLPGGIGGILQEEVESVRIANDGKILLGGTARSFPSPSRLVFARLNSDGSIDTTFGTDGRLLARQFYFVDEFHDMDVLPDGSLIAVAGSIGANTSSTRIVVKYDVNGNEVWTNQPPNPPSNSSTQSGLYGIALAADGKIIVSGSDASNSLLVRLNTDGTEDNTFVTPAVTPGSRFLDVAIQTDGKIVVNYFVRFSQNNSSSFSLARFNPDGSLDSGFGNGGSVDTNVTAGSDTANKILIQPDGKILIGGYSNIYDPKTEVVSFYFSMVRYLGGNVVPQTPRFDYDGDGKADISVYRPSNGVWYLNQSTNGFGAIQFGISTDKIVPADFDGDGKTDLAIYREGVWWILQSETNTVKVVQFGIAEDKPQAGDFDGDGKDDLAVWRPSNGVWYFLRSSDNGFYGIQFGLSDDIPQSSDYDGDGQTDVAVFRPSDGTWHILKSLSGYSLIRFGLVGDIPMANDYDGDGNSDTTVWRPSSGDWYVLRSSSNQVYRTNFGVTGDIPVAADYDGDGKTDISVFRPMNGIWYQLLSTQGWTEQLFGLSNDKPTPSAYNP